MAAAYDGAGPGARPSWHVALSFAGAQRDYVRQVGEVLQAQGVRCFYDADDEIELWGKSLAEALPVIYGDQAAAAVVFVSAEYAARDWTRLERRAVLARAAREPREYVLPVRFDDTSLPGLLPDVSYVDLRTKTPRQFAAMIVGKLADLGITGPTLASAHNPDRDVTASRPRAPLAPLGTLLFRMETGHGVNGVAFSPDGARLATVGDGSGSPLMWDVATGTKLGQMKDAGLSYDPAGKTLAFSPDGAWLATGGREALVRDVATGRELVRMERHGFSVAAVAFSPNGTVLATGSDDGTARLWDVATGRELVRMPHGDDAEVEAVAFSPDGTVLATGSDDGTARLWDLATGRERARMDDGGEIIMAVAFSPDGTRLATGGSGSPRLWDVATGGELVWMELDPSWVSAVAFSPDGTRLATGGDDGTARLWRTATGRELARMEHGPRPPEPQSKKPRRRRGKRQAPADRQVDVKAVAFSPDGTLLATGNDDNTARLWAV
jgi:sugar lactone lactonase YvrE